MKARSAFLATGVMVSLLVGTALSATSDDGLTAMSAEELDDLNTLINGPPIPAAPQVRVPLKKPLVNARAIIGEARGWLPTLIIGPIPIIEDMQPYVFPNGIAYHYTNERVAELNASTASLSNVSPRRHAVQYGRPWRHI